MARGGRMYDIMGYECMSYRYINRTHDLSTNFFFGVQ